MFQFPGHSDWFRVEHDPVWANDGEGNPRLKEVILEEINSSSLNKYFEIGTTSATLLPQGENSELGDEKLPELEDEARHHGK